MIKLRFVQGSDLTCKLIIARSSVCMPFTPTHVECVTPQGKYLGQRVNGGMLARDPGYDHDDLRYELFVDLPATEAQTEKFYDFMESKIGAGYDWKAVLDYVLPINMHTFNQAICSAVVHLGLRAADWYPSHCPLTVPAHLISPRDLMLMLSCIVVIEH